MWCIIKELGLVTGYIELPSASFRLG
jgi:hypothetical protein